MLIVFKYQKIDPFSEAKSNFKELNKFKKEEEIGIFSYELYL